MNTYIQELQTIYRTYIHTTYIHTYYCILTEELNTYIQNYIHMNTYIQIFIASHFNTSDEYIYIYIYIFLFIHTYMERHIGMCVYMYIYIYIERERDAAGAPGGRARPGGGAPGAPPEVVIIVTIDSTDNTNSYPNSTITIDSIYNSSYNDYPKGGPISLFWFRYFGLLFV